MLPFPREQFLAVFAAYNEAIWPAQMVAYVLWAIALAVLFRPRHVSSRIIAAILSGMWLWTGIAYHWLFFAAINKAAYLFGALFVIEGLALAYCGLVRDQLRFTFRPGLAAWIGLAFLVYAAIAYPAISMGLGHAYPEMPMFGVTPCPVTIFTFGMLLQARNPMPRWLLAIPFLWSLIGGSAAILLDVPQDWVLLVSGLIAVPLILLRGRSVRRWLGRTDQKRLFADHVTRLAVQMHRSRYLG